MIKEKEDVSSDETVIEQIDESSDPEIKNPFDPTKISMNVKPLIIDSLVKRLKSDPPRIDLNTEFQRRGNLWSEKAQSRLIESLLVRIPIPAFYFDCTDEDNWKVVDGLQRLTTLKNFIIDQTLRLHDLEFLVQYNGASFGELPAYLQGRIEETQITVYNINPGTPPDVKYNIFSRINTGGLILKPQEIRHALNQGKPADFIRDLAELPEFQKATHHLLTNHKRMEDRDFVNRFIGFYEGYENYRSELDDHLNDAMGKLGTMTESELNNRKIDFSKAMKASFALFGKYTFRKMYELDGRKSPLNKAIFDTLSVNLAKLSQEDINQLIAKKNVVLEKWVKLMNDEDFSKAITLGTGKIQSVKHRFSLVGKLFKEILNA